MQTIPQGHQKPFSNRKLQIVSLSDDQHVWAGQGGVEVVQVDLTVIGHDPNTDVRPVLAILAEEGKETKRGFSYLCWSERHCGQKYCRR